MALLCDFVCCWYFAIVLFWARTSTTNIRQLLRYSERAHIPTRCNPCFLRWRAWLNNEIKLLVGGVVVRINMVSLTYFTCCCLRFTPIYIYILHLCPRHRHPPTAIQGFALERIAYHENGVGGWCFCTHPVATHSPTNPCLPSYDSRFLGWHASLTRENDRKTSTY